MKIFDLESEATCLNLGRNSILSLIVEKKINFCSSNLKNTRSAINFICFLFKKKMTKFDTDLNKTLCLYSKFIKKIFVSVDFSDKFLLLSYEHVKNDD